MDLAMLEDGGMRAVGLFSGIGGFELGLADAGIETELLCELWSPAGDVLRRRFFSAEIVGDIREIQSLPSVDVVTAGFPCTDLSQVGRAAGIGGTESGLVREVFRLIEAGSSTWLVLENVPNMLSLHGGAAMHHIAGSLEALGWNWAYRTVDSRHFGVRQRRRRVYLVASRSEDPRGVLFVDETGPAPQPSEDAYGFSWTEGNRGLGWGVGVTPTLRGGSGLGIPSPPGVWIPGRPVGRAILRPSTAVGERLQGFRAGWTAGVPRAGERWKMLGNAVTVDVARWIGRRLREPGDPAEVPRRPIPGGSNWPSAAASMCGRRESWAISERPIATRVRRSLATVLDTHGADPLTLKATAGFSGRLKASRLKFSREFMAALDDHIEFMSVA